MAYSFGGEDFWHVLEVNVVMNDIAFVQNCFNSVLTHEVGHTLGFRHVESESDEQRRVHAAAGLLFDRDHEFGGVLRVQRRVAAMG